METLLANLGIGFGAVLAFEPLPLFGLTLPVPMNLVYAFFGAFVGTLIGVLPGIGPLATIAMLLPATYVLPPLGGLIMLAGHLLRRPVRRLDHLDPGQFARGSLIGRDLRRRLPDGAAGRAGAALTTAALGSFFAGCVATVLVAAFAAPLAEIAFQFGPAEYFSLMVLGLISAVVLASGSLVKASAMVCLGLLGGLVGTDVNSGVSRYAFDIPELADGIGFVVVAMGMFGFAEVIRGVEQKEVREVFTTKVTDLFPTKADFKRMIAPVLRGTALGSLLGILPGGGSRSLRRSAPMRLKKSGSKNRAEFGKGRDRGRGRAGVGQ